MGSITSRQNAAVEEADISANHAYKYPPRAGTYFGSHFIMGGERFDTPQPESYLFGENGDLNFLGNRPTAFPYPPPQANEPTKTLKSLVNIRKESVRFVKAPDTAIKVHGECNATTRANSFNIEFIFDADAKCAITIYYFCTEEVTPNGLTYIPRDASMTSETFYCKRGVNQLFLQSSHIFNPTLYPDDLSYNPDVDVYPIAIHCVVDEGPEENRQSHTTICVVDHHSDGTYGLRALKQKIFVDGLCYLLQEIYGIENKNITKTNIDDDSDDNSSECVICMSDTRDTLILPCRHLCLCNSCADSLRYQANNCPICRAPFRALLQIRAVQKSSNGQANIGSPQQVLQETNGENIPPGYVAVSLIEALNGPPPTSASHKSQLDITVPDSNETDSIKAAAEALNRSQDGADKGSRDKKDKTIPPEIRMSVLLPKDEVNAAKSTTRERSPRQKSASKQQNRDAMHMVNEKNAANLQGADPDDDSEAENLSPLLQTKAKKSSKHGRKTGHNTSGSAVNSSTAQQTSQVLHAPPALHIDGVNESIDDTDTDADEHICEKNGRSIGPNSMPNATINDAIDTENVVIGADDSDYYTPEDPHTTILSPLCPEKNKAAEKAKSKENLSSSAAPSPLAALKESASSSLPDSPISASSTSTRCSADSYSSSSSTRKLLSTSSVPMHEMATVTTPSIAASRIIDIKVCDDKQISIDKAVDV